MGGDLSIADNDHSEIRQVRIGSQIFIHPKSREEDNDLAIVKVSVPFYATDLFSPVLVFEFDTVPDDYTNCSIAGWGRTSEVINDF